MEPGPALFFTKDQMTITPEAPLPEGSDGLDVGNWDAADQDVGTNLDTLEAVREELFNDALGWWPTISDVSSLLLGDLANVAETVPADITYNVDLTQQAIDGAESSFLPDAYQETPPWYTPPVDEAPVEEPRPPKGPAPESQ